MFNASNGRVNTSKKAMVGRPENRTSWLAGPVNAGTNAKMCNDSVKGDSVRKSYK